MKLQFTVWTEPFHVNGASVVDVKSYMVSAIPGLSLTENATKTNIQLVYSKPGTSEGILYSFSPVDGGLYSVIDTEAFYHDECGSGETA
jgi:hypothetical protein